MPPRREITIKSTERQGRSNGTFESTDETVVLTLSSERDASGQIRQCNEGQVGNTDV